MNKLKLVAVSAVSAVSALLPFIAKAGEEEAYQALEDSIATGTTNALAGVTDNLPTILGFAFVIVVIMIVWRLFRRMAGGR